MSEVSSHVHGDGHQERRGGRAGGVPVENARRLDDPHLTADESEVKISRASEPEVTDALIAYIDRSQLGLTELRTHSPTLDDVFVSLTGRTLRDGA